MALKFKSLNSSSPNLKNLEFKTPISRSEKIISSKLLSVSISRKISPLFNQTNEIIFKSFSSTKSSKSSKCVVKIPSISALSKKFLIRMNRPEKKTIDVKFLNLLPFSRNGLMKERPNVKKRTFSFNVGLIQHKRSEKSIT